ncbi:carbohydrate ABC transporter permease [Dictyobacter aurantiacus]|uniref:ABC transporter permease n=1 Tax=Dictyobacter aurantiacus TaxID=1936993 RepID=A0A401ZRG8_9CHLR|nr:carbohydrate ABC transporter permease [Dictyobacter aurantiacus]GCE09396.1 ABC transporter permease [Dictyobacter aurantiacus]
MRSLDSSPVSLESTSPTAAMATRVRRPKTRHVRSRKRIVFYLVAYFIIALALLLYLFPLLSLVNVSLKTPSEFILDPTGLAKALHWQNFVNAWSKGNFGATILNSLLYTVVASMLSTVLAVLLAFPIARGYIRGSRYWYVLFILSLFMPSALIPQFQLIVRIGLYDTQIGYILLNAATLGVGPFLIIGYLRSMPKDLDEAAAIDGCGYFRYVFTIVVPLIKPVLVTAFILHAIGVWNDIIGPTIYLSNAQYSPVTLGLFSFYGQYGNEWAELSAATLIVALPLIVLYIALQRYFIEGAMGGSLKS